ncbi:MAG: polysaccharide biosynthesis/export family protein [Planctomycetota bacterium]
MIHPLRLFAGLPLALVACTTGDLYWPDEDLMRRFEAAGPIQPEFDASQLPRAPMNRGPYEVVPSDVLTLSGLDAALPAGSPSPLTVRVGDDGAVSLGRLGQLAVAGKTLSRIEAELAALVHPKWLKFRPTVLAQVAQPRTRRVAILGNVVSPGYHDLTADNLSLVGALTSAGGILASGDTTTGARLIRISRPDAEPAGDATAGAPAAPILMPVRGLNIPFSDVALEGGETIEVERWDPAIFTVIGLVGQTGAFEYPRDSQYNLLQALAIAGGADPVSGPPYATIYRKEASGEVLAVSFEIRGDARREAEVLVKPGDIISVQHTVGTWTRETMSQIVRLQLGLIYNPFNPQQGGGL